MPVLSADLAATLNRWPRRVAALICLLLALGSAVAGRRGASSRPALLGTPVVVAAHDIAGGASLRGADLRVARWPAAMVPAHRVSDPARLVGHRVSSPVARGEAVTSMRLVGTDLAAALPAGEVAVPVTIADPNSAALVRPGDTADLITVPDDSATPDVPVQRTQPAIVLLAGVRVLAVLAPGYSGDAAAGVGIIVATNRTGALRIAGHAGHGVLAVRDQPP